MTQSITVKRTALAACLTAPLALTACGSGEEAETATGLATETNIVTVAPNAGEPKDGEKKVEDEDKDKDPNKPEDPAAQGEAAPGAPEPGAAGVVNPFENGNLPTVQVEPIQGGKPASRGDIQAMTETMNRIYNPPGVVEWPRQIMNNSCKRVVDQTNSELAAQGTSLEATERQMRDALNAAKAAGQRPPAIPKTTASLADVKVDGNSASATVTVKTDGQTESGVQRFERENGQWKVCN